MFRGTVCVNSKVSAPKIPGNSFVSFWKFWEKLRIEIQDIVGESFGQRCGYQLHKDGIFIGLETPNFGFDATLIKNGVLKKNGFLVFRGNITHNISFIYNFFGKLEKSRIA